MTDSIDDLAGAIEDWKQAKYFFIRLLQDVHDSSLDVDAFRDEAVDDRNRIDTALFDLVMELEDAREDRRMDQ